MRTIESQTERRHVTFPLLAETGKLYRSRAALFVRIIVPAFVFGYLAIWWTGERASAIWQGGVRARYALPDWHVMVSSLGIRAAGFFGSWLLYCFAFAGICGAVRAIRFGQEPDAEECLNPVRERFGPLVLTSVVLLGMTCVALGLAFASSFAVVGLLLRMKILTSPLGVAARGAYAVIMLLWLAPVTWYALAVPASTLDRLPVRAALRRSSELTDDYVVALPTLMLESVACGYIAAISPWYLYSWIAPHVGVPEWGWWMLFAAGMICSLLVQPIMFVGFSLLYEGSAARESNARESEIRAGGAKQ